METNESYVAFDGEHLFCRGDLSEVVIKVKRRVDKKPESKLLIFSDLTGKSIDFNFSGDESELRKRLEIFVPRNEKTTDPSGPGRPKLGVISREISLLPRHWEWLATQPGGASVTLRKLVDAAKKQSTGEMTVKQAQERTYRFALVMAGDLAGYEESIRALYRKDMKGFKSHIRDWPRDVREHALELASPVFFET